MKKGKLFSQVTNEEMVENTSVEALGNHKKSLQNKKFDSEPSESENEDSEYNSGDNNYSEYSDNDLTYFENEDEFLKEKKTDVWKNSSKNFHHVLN
jgi:hypothetical protein